MSTNNGTYKLDTKALRNLETDMSMVLNEQLTGQGSTYGSLVNTINVNTNTVRMPYMDDLGDGLRSWDRDDTKRIETLQGGDFTVTIDSWEKTIGIRREDIEDDNLGLYAPVISQMAKNVLANDDKLIAEMIAGGDAVECFDGVYLFSNSHPTRTSAVQDNLMSGALNADNVASGIAQMRGFVGRNGEVYNLAPTTLIVPPELEKTAWELVNSLFKTDSGTYNDQPNFVRSKLQNVIVDNRLTDADDWYLVNTGESLKPVLKLMRKPAQFASLRDMNSEIVFMKGQYIFGLETRYSIAPGYWQYIIKFVN